MARGGSVTLEDVNTVLASRGQPISTTELKKLIALTFTMYPLTATGVKDPSFLARRPPRIVL
jgi:hypothetical protein